MRTRRPFIVTATIVLGACHKEATPEPSAPSDVAAAQESTASVEQPPAEPAVAAIPEVVEKPDAGPGAKVPVVTKPGTLPKWEDVESTTPKGATNPPLPVLSVTEDGDCYKKWRSPFGTRDPAELKAAVRDCEAVDCGTQIQCPPEAEAVLESAKQPDAAPK